jgi:hypothetical protein
MARSSEILQQDATLLLQVTDHVAIRMLSGERAAVSHSRSIR